MLDAEADTEGALSTENAEELEETADKVLDAVETEDAEAQDEGALSTKDEKELEGTDDTVAIKRMTAPSWSNFMVENRELCGLLSSKPSHFVQRKPQSYSWLFAQSLGELRIAGDNHNREHTQSRKRPMLHGMITVETRRGPTRPRPDSQAHVIVVELFSLRVSKLYVSGFLCRLPRMYLHTQLNALRNLVLNLISSDGAQPSCVYSIVVNQVK